MTKDGSLKKNLDFQGKMIINKDLPTKEAEPIPEVLISVGKSSAPYRKITPKENVMHIFPEKKLLLKIKHFEKKS